VTLGLDEWPCAQAGGAWHVLIEESFGALDFACGASLASRETVVRRQIRYSTADMCPACAAAISKKGKR